MISGMWDVSVSENPPRGSSSIWQIGQKNPKIIRGNEQETMEKHKHFDGYFFSEFEKITKFHKNFRTNPPQWNGSFAANGEGDIVWGFSCVLSRTINDYF